MAALVHEGSALQARRYRVRVCMYIYIYTSVYMYIYIYAACVLSTLWLQRALSHLLTDTRVSGHSNS